MQASPMNFILYRLVECDRVAEYAYLISPKESFEKLDLHFWRQVNLLSGQSITPEVLAELPLDEIWNKSNVQQLLPTAHDRLELLLHMAPPSLQYPHTIKLAHNRIYSPYKDVYILERLIPNSEERMKLLNLYEALQGRKLTFKEILRYLHEKDLDELSLSPLEIIQLGYLLGAIDWVSPFSEGVCKRCGYGSHTPFLSSINSPPANLLTSLMDFFKHLLSHDQLIPFNCARCQKTCYYCPNCMQLGVLQSCLPLVVGAIPSKLMHTFQQHLKTIALLNPEHSKNVSIHDKYLNWNGTYTAFQQKAVDELKHYLREVWHDPTDMDFFHEYVLWAVCGAGKTELVYPAIEFALQLKKKILITSPRKDVILELAPRIKAAFPTVDMTALYAESEEKHASGEIILATSHQVMRFEQAFDFIIIDEEDAFPFSTERELHHAIRSAMTSSATIVYVTATPSPLIMKRIKKDLISYSRITERYHGHPLAIPELIPIGNWRKSVKRGEIISQLLDFVLHLTKTNRQAFIFVPHVDDVELVQAYLQDVLLPYIKELDMEQRGININQMDRDERLGLTEKLENAGKVEKPELTEIPGREGMLIVEGVFAQHEHRIDTIKRFRTGKVQLLVTTSILERGVTIPHSDCAILGSDEAVFSTAALIQMAGRVGRKLEDPVGQVWFFPGARTAKQKRAIETIMEWNEEAKRLRC